MESDDEDEAISSLLGNGKPPRDRRVDKDLLLPKKFLFSSPFFSSQVQSSLLDHVRTGNRHSIAVEHVYHGAYGEHVVHAQLI